MKGVQAAEIPLKNIVLPATLHISATVPVVNLGCWTETCGGLQPDTDTITSRRE